MSLHSLHVSHYRHDQAHLCSKPLLGPLNNVRICAIGILSMIISPDTTLGDAVHFLICSSSPDVNFVHLRLFEQSDDNSVRPESDKNRTLERSTVH